MPWGCIISGHRCPGEAKATQAAFPGFMVFTVGAVQLMMTGVRRMRCLCLVSLRVWHVGLHRPAQEQLQHQNQENERADDTHNVTQYALGESPVTQDTKSTPAEVILHRLDPGQFFMCMSGYSGNHQYS